MGRSALWGQSHLEDPVLSIRIQAALDQPTTAHSYERPGTELYVDRDLEGLCNILLWFGAPCITFMLRRVPAIQQNFIKHLLKMK